MKLKRNIILFCSFFILNLFVCGNIFAVENSEFTRLFNDYEESVDLFITAFTNHEWKTAQKEAVTLEKKSKHLMELGRTDSNKDWQFDSSNLYHHSIEMVDAANDKNGVDCTYLVSTLIAHIGYIQSANPRWLKVHIEKQIEIIDSGISSKDREKTRDAAEITHISANKIVLSSGIQKGVYVHKRWINEVRMINKWGDDIIGFVNEGNWSEPKNRLAKIKVAFGKWKRAFK